MPANGGQVTLRLSVAGQEAVKASLRELGPEGAKAMRQIELAGRQASTSLKVIDSTAREVKGGMASMAESSGALGRVVGNLGAIGIAAASGMGALTLALGKTREALDFVDNLGDAATKLRVSVESLQEWRYAAQEANLEAASFDTSIQGLQSSVGKFVSGIGGARVAKAFEALGISREQAASFKSVSDMLPLLADRLRAVGSEAEKVAIADKLGVRELLPLLEQGSDKIGEMTKRARDLGIVLDSKTVQSMGDLQRKTELASQAIDVNLKQAFLSLAPLLASTTKMIADMTRGISGFLSQFTAIENRSRAQLEYRRSGIMAENKNNRIRTAINAPELARIDQAMLEMDIAAKANVGTGQRGQAAPSAAARATTLTAGAYSGAGADGLGGGGGGGGRSRGSGGAGAFMAKKPALAWNADTSSPATVIPSTIVDLTDYQLKAVDWKSVLEPVSTAVRDNTVEGFSEAKDQSYSALREAVKGGLEAGFDGGAKGALKYFVDRLRNQVFEGLVDSITSALSSQVSSRPGGSGLMNSVLSTFGFGGGGGQARSGSGGAQGGGLFSSVLSSIFGGGGFQPSMTTPPYIPARAAGGMAFGTTLVGERGPELVNFTQPGMVFSNDRSRRMMQGLGQGIGAGPGGSGRQGQVFNIDNRKIINAAGADPAALKRVEERIDQFQSGEPERWLAYQNSYNRASR
jgi:hypothetical protein